MKKGWSGNLFALLPLLDLGMRAHAGGKFDCWWWWRDEWI